MIQFPNEEQFVENLQQVGFPVYERISPQLVKAITDHNQHHGTLQKRFDDRAKAFRDATAQLDVGADYGKVFAAIEDTRMDVANIAQDLATLWANRKKVSEAALVEFKAELGPAEKVESETIAKVKADFEKIGSGLAAMPGYMVGQGTAESQLHWLVCNRNTHAIKAVAAVVNVKARVEAAEQQIKVSNAGIEQVHLLIMKVIIHRQLAGFRPPGKHAADFSNHNFTFHTRKTMAQFQDNQNRTWQLSLSVGIARSIQRQHAIDLLDYSESSKIVALPYHKLKFSAVLWSLIGEQAQQQNVSEDQFYDSLDSPVLESAHKALVETYLGFCGPQERETVRKVMAAQTDAIAEAGKRAAALVDSPETKQAFAKVIDEAAAEARQQLQALGA